MKTADYSGTDNNIPHNDRLKICFSKNMVILSGKVTQIDDLANSYILNLVIFDPMGEGRVYENKVIVKYDGSIQEVSMNKLISSCDEGQMVF